MAYFFLLKSRYLASCVPEPQLHCTAVNRICHSHGSIGSNLQSAILILIPRVSHSVTGSFLDTRQVMWLPASKCTMVQVPDQELNRASGPDIAVLHPRKIPVTVSWYQ